MSVILLSSLPSFPLHSAVYFGRKNGVVDSEYHQQFLEALNNDLDTPRVIALLWDLLKDEHIKKEDKRATFLDFDRVLAIGFADGVKKLKEMLSVNVVTETDLTSEVAQLMDERERAREEKDWKTADTLRKKIEDKGFLVQDGEEGPTVYKKST